MTSGKIEIEVGDVSNMEARVVARFRPTADESGETELIVLRGVLRGPYCERAKTLPAEYAFRALERDVGIAEAVVPDPCLWSAELPHLYHVEIEAREGSEVVAEFRGQIGLRFTP